jgi:hypothetical protein
MKEYVVDVVRSNLTPDLYIWPRGQPQCMTSSFWEASNYEETASPVTPSSALVLEKCIYIYNKASGFTGLGIDTYIISSI